MLSFANRSFAAVLATAATAFTLAAATPVRAETVSVPVAYGDLDLASPAGVASLNRRVRHVAEALCGVTGRIDVATARCIDRVQETARLQVASAVARKSNTQLAAR